MAGSKESNVVGVGVTVYWSFSGTSTLSKAGSVSYKYKNKIIKCTVVARRWLWSTSYKPKVILISYCPDRYWNWRKKRNRTDIHNVVTEARKYIIFKANFYTWIWNNILILTCSGRLLLVKHRALRLDSKSYNLSTAFSPLSFNSNNFHNSPQPTTRIAAAKPKHKGNILWCCRHTVIQSNTQIKVQIKIKSNTQGDHFNLGPYAHTHYQVSSTYSYLVYYAWELFFGKLINLYDECTVNQLSISHSVIEIS